MGLVRSLKILLLGGLAALVVALALSAAAGARQEPALAAEPPPDPQDSDAFVQQGSLVRIERTREGIPTLRLSAESSRTRVSGVMELEQVSFTLFGPSGRTTRIEAPRATSTPPQRAPAAPPAAARAGAAGGTPFGPSLQAGLGSWHLSGGVVLEGPGDLRVTMPSLVYDEAGGVARSAEPVSFRRGPAVGSCVGMEYDVAAQTMRFVQDVQAAMDVGGLGKVAVLARSGTYDTLHGRFRMADYRAETSRGEILEGRTLAAAFHEAGGLSALEGTDGFELTTTHAQPTIRDASPLSRLLALEGRRTMRGQRLTIHMDQDERPDTIEVSGQASVITGADGQGVPSSLDAQTLLFDLTRGSLTRARASGDVALSKATGAGEGGGFRMRSENLDARFDPEAGLLLGVSGEGHIQLWDQGIQSEGSRTFLDPDTDIVTLVGDGDAPARVTWTGRTIEARRIEVNRRQQTLTAREGVRASLQTEAPASAEGAKRAAGGALPFFKPGEMMHAVADRLIVSDDGRTARYEGRVRLWQGESRLEAGQVDVRESDGTLGAGGDVTTTFRQPPPSGAAASANPTDQIVTVSSATMSYRRRDDRVDYAGKVLVTQGATRVTGEALAVFLKPGGSTAERLEADGNVEVRDRGRVGRGDRLVVDLVKDTLRLIGSRREATVQDESNQQVVRGSSLTMDRSGDRILVESEMGGRTWITLKPRQKGAPGVGTDPDH